MVAQAYKKSSVYRYNSLFQVPFWHASDEGAKGNYYGVWRDVSVTDWRSEQVEPSGDRHRGDLEG